MIRILVLPALVFAALGCATQPEAPQGPQLFAVVDSARLMADLRFLASPERAGRGAGTPGNAAARDYIENEFRAAGLLPTDGQWLQAFPLRSSTEGARGANVIGYLPGTVRPDLYLVLTAHFDHLGTRNGIVFPGADDNASGTAAVMELARYFRQNPPRHSIIFAALDAEEGGLQGARAFVAEPPVPLESIALNVNLDMISRSERRELYAAGTYHYPFLTPLVEEVASSSGIRVVRGHDRPDGPPADDWTTQSDHGAFHAAGIPFLYFGVEDHPDYHRPSDTVERIDPGFYLEAVRTIIAFVRLADDQLEAIDARAMGGVGASAR